MNYILAAAWLCLSLFASAQNQDPDLDNLVKLGEIYSKNVNATGEAFKTSIEELRTPGLTHIIDVLLLIGKGDKALLSKEHLSKPAEKELKYWYAIEEIGYNNRSKAPRPNTEVAKETIEKEINKYWLLDNYYSTIRSGFARMFNEENLSSHNFDLNDYGLEDDTEKAIFFLQLNIAFTQRFMVLDQMNNFDKLLEYAGKLPSFNGKPYYEFTKFDFNDFNTNNHDKQGTYKEVYMGLLYYSLFSHLAALTPKSQADKFEALYTKSILSKPEYFKYAGLLQKEVKKLYKKAKP